MRLNFLGGILAVFIVAALIVAYSSFFTVFQTQQALLVRLGQPVRVVNEPGLNLKTRSSTRLSRREAAEFRAQGAQRAQEIRSRADREVTVLVAEATSKSEQIRGEGDATRNQIFADAFNQDQDFFAFYRSMQAYEQGLKSNDTRMLVPSENSIRSRFAW